MPHSNQEGGKENDNLNEFQVNLTTNGGCIIGAASACAVKKDYCCTLNLWSKTRN